jgi:hypothetical protein
MMKLSTALILAMMIASGAVAHEGSIGLYTSQSALDCDVDLNPFIPYDITVMYFRSDGGPDGITACEFKVGGFGATPVSITFTPSPEVSATNGDILTSLAISFSNCVGSGDDLVFIGTISLTLLSPAATFSMNVLPSDNLGKPPYSPRATDCGPLNDRQIYGLLGGWFTSPDGSCLPGTDEATWGAIKEMYSK